jgi:hypothetical protein
VVCKTRTPAEADRDSGQLYLAQHQHMCSHLLLSNCDQGYYLHIPVS